MSLHDGALLFKLEGKHSTDDTGQAARALSRIRDFIYAMPDEGMEVSNETLAQLLCPKEAYVLYEVKGTVSYEQEKQELGEADGYMTTVTPKLKVVY